jgi:hypothetical protein
MSVTRGAAMNIETTMNRETAADTESPKSGHAPLLQIAAGIGAIVGYGCLAAFLALIGVQIYRWFREGEWTHFGAIDGLRVILEHCCVKDAENGRLAALLHWLDTPLDWLGVHKVLEVMPASLALFALSMVGNSLFIYCRDRLDRRVPSL